MTVNKLYAGLFHIFAPQHIYTELHRNTHLHQFIPLALGITIATTTTSSQVRIAEFNRHLIKQADTIGVRVVIENQPVLISTKQPLAVS